jgi:hypothetical protein
MAEETASGASQAVVDSGRDSAFASGGARGLASLIHAFRESELTRLSTPSPNGVHHGHGITPDAPCLAHAATKTLLFLLIGAMYLHVRHHQLPLQQV